MNNRDVALILFLLWLLWNNRKPIEDVSVTIGPPERWGPSL